MWCLVYFSLVLGQVPATDCGYSLEVGCQMRAFIINNGGDNTRALCRSLVTQRKLQILRQVQAVQNSSQVQE